MKYWWRIAFLPKLYLSEENFMHGWVRIPSEIFRNNRVAARRQDKELAYHPKRPHALLIYARIPPMLLDDVNATC
jgi:hypothetical protein